MPDTDRMTTLRSRRAILAAAASGAAAVAAASVALPSAVLAADPNDVARDIDNPTTALTSITQGTAGTGAFAANGNGDGEGVIGTTDTSPHRRRARHRRKPGRLDL